MIRNFTTYPVTDFSSLKIKMLNWANQFSIFCFLDNHQYNFPPHQQECLLATGCSESIESPAGNALKKLEEFQSRKNDWLFGHLAYDLKNEIENLQSGNYDGIGFPDLHFFVPLTIIELRETAIRINSLDNSPEEIYKAIQACSDQTPLAIIDKPQVQARMLPSEYLETVSKLRNHILYGDCYEINYCQEFYVEDYFFNPLGTFLNLSEYSPNPFSAYYRLNDKYLICASPERYLKRKGSKLISQPIKGTSARYPGDQARDLESRNSLAGSDKDKAENVMVVDLVRNDLSRVCIPGSVEVDELFGIYSFPQVHQLISTVSGQMSSGKTIGDIIRACFPMGSMTGAPKKRVMELIEQYETTRRGLFSGALGYIEPGGDFDFNVVIRSLLYNQANQYLSFQVGSGITFYSDPESEYQECLLKAAAIKKVLAG